MVDSPIYSASFGRAVKNSASSVEPSSSLNKISKAFSKFEQENERRPSPEELADELDIPVDKISDTLKVSGRHIPWMPRSWKVKTTAFWMCL